jgi:hypothetical protein
MSDEKSTGPTISDLPQPETDANVKGGASAYIGETEKTLDRTLTSAQRTNVSLFFTDSDDLFTR